MGNEVKEKKNSRKRVSLADAKKWLQRNDLADIAAEVGLTRGQVSNILHGRSKNFSVAAKIIARAQANKAIMDQTETIK